MTQKNRYARTKLTTTSVCILLALALLPLVALAAELPPSPPPPPLPAPANITGATLELRVQFSQAWPWATIRWQDLWTVVQRQKSIGGGWCDVAGWQGGLDGVAVGTDGEITGQKAWWVAKEDLGRGTYRWLVYEGEGGDLLATSDPFYPPDASGRPVTVEVPLVP